MTKTIAEGMNCEICKKPACYCSTHWLIKGGMLVLYWCADHAPVGAEFFETP